MNEENKRTTGSLSHNNQQQQEADMQRTAVGTFLDHLWDIIELFLTDYSKVDTTAIDE